MIPWIIQISIISLILIILVHYLFTFFMTNLTIPKVKDLVNKPQQQYETLYNTMKEQPILKQKGNENMTNENMKNELKNYLKELSDNTSTSNNSNNSNNSNSNINNVNNLGGLLTGESFGNNGSSSYSTF
jgi:ABC-type bacteriocin/lantibiotic exporter with double-glycine peptidase domain